MLKEIDKSYFENSVLESERLSIVLFKEDDSKECQEVEAILEELSDKYVDVLFYKINVNKEREVAVNYYIMNTPTVMFFVDGDKEEEEIGYKDLQDFESLIRLYID